MHPAGMKVCNFGCRKKGVDPFLQQTERVPVNFLISFSILKLTISIPIGDGGNPSTSGEEKFINSRHATLMLILNIYGGSKAFLKHFYPVRKTIRLNPNEADEPGGRRKAGKDHFSKQRSKFGYN
jgi:hypothetical protein